MEYTCLIAVLSLAGSIAGVFLGFILKSAFIRFVKVKSFFSNEQ